MGRRLSGENVEWMLICVDCTSEPTSRQVRSGQTMGRMLSGDYVEKMLMSVD